MGKTTIAWTNRTWNPIRGCSRISSGCSRCYAEAIAARFSKPGQPFEGFAERRLVGVTGEEDGRIEGRWTGRVELIPEKLDEPLRWRKPARVFVNSMSDLFHESLTSHEIGRVFATMANAPRHTFQILTKRPKRMLNFFMEMSLVEAPLILTRSAGKWPLPNVWLGVSVEDQKTADERIPLLLKTPAAVRFVSYEPALGTVDFRWGGASLPEFAPHRPLPTVDWLIVGGESGPGAWPCDLAWIRSAVRQCKESGTAAFVKQAGSTPVDSDRICGTFSPFDARSIARTAALGLDPENPPNLVLLKDRKGGDPSEWPEDLRVREFPGATNGR